ncbi:MAG: hypothetical protein ACOC1L_00425 [Bacillota bacterium]
MKRKVYTVFRILIFIAFVLNVVGIFFVSDDSQTSRFVFNAMQALLFLIVSLLPDYIEKKANVEMSSLLSIMFIILLIGHFVLGEIAEFYVYVRGWDSLLHAFSGVILGIVAMAIVQYITQDNKNVYLSPLFIVLFAVSFAVTIAVVWEIIEYIIDGLFNSNMQRFKDSVTGEPFTGRAALRDTMKDLILDMIGALGVAIIGYLDIKRQNLKRWRLFEAKPNVHSLKIKK